MPMTTENRMTTNVVAYTSLRLGQVTRPISLRTSERKRRDRLHHPVTLSRARPPNESSGSAATVFIATFVLGARASTSHWQDRRESNPQPPVLETGALPIELLSFVTSLNHQSTIHSPIGNPSIRESAIANRRLLRFPMRLVAAAEAAV